MRTKGGGVVTRVPGDCGGEGGASVALWVLLERASSREVPGNRGGEAAERWCRWGRGAAALGGIIEVQVDNNNNNSKFYFVISINKIRATAPGGPESHLASLGGIMWEERHAGKDLSADGGKIR